MYIDVCEETFCSNCIHREVCSLTKEFLAAQNAVNDLMVHLEDRKSIRLRDIKWIKRVMLECVHYIQKRSTRDNHLAKDVNCSTHSSSN